MIMNINTIIKTLLLVGLILSLFPACSSKPGGVIVYPEDSSAIEQLAAKEVRRYIYLRTGKLLELQSSNIVADGFKNVIVVGNNNREIFQYPAIKNLEQNINNLATESYYLKTIKSQGKTITIIAGGASSGTLYGAYEFAEQLGVRFYLHGDVIPDEKIVFQLPELDKTGRPLFNIRGIQPFHDFPEGPDWWNVDDYKAILAQLPKLKMNFFGLHTYPEGHVGPEPTVWIGRSQDISDNGNVNFSYPARHFSTQNGTWGYSPQNTGEYSFGASELFERDVFSAEYMKGIISWPDSRQKCNDLFNRVGDMLGQVFLYANTLGIKTCVGTETPLMIPKEVKKRLLETGKNPEAFKTVQELYEGIFTWIKKNYSINYYWFWTPEGWTWGGNTAVELEVTKNDISAAIAAQKNVKAPFTLATCGWVLGPRQDRAMFDKFLPKEMPMSCINREVGFSPVEIGFARVKNRPKWAIPWLEDDPALIIPQLWAGRMRKDAADALSYGCTGLMGIHWRTRILGPNVSALAKAAWEQQEWNPDFGKKPELPESEKMESIALVDNPRDLPVADFYKDWALTLFGKEVAYPVGKLFSRLDGSSLVKDKNARRANLPRPSDWVRGPGGIKPDSSSWEIASQDYSFVDEMENLRKKVKGQGNLERFDYWLNNFRYMKAIGKLNCTLYQFNSAMEKVKAEKDAEKQKDMARDRVLPIRIKLMEELKDIFKYLLATVSTNGGIGNVTNWQQHVIPMQIDNQIKELENILGKELPANALPSSEYSGVPRMFVPTVRTNINAGENLKIKAILLSVKPKTAKFHWKEFNEQNFQEIDLVHVNRGVFTVTLPPSSISRDFEYYIEVQSESGINYYLPPTAPELNQTIVVWNATK